MKVLVLIPTYNEALNVSSLIPEILKCGNEERQVEVLVIDDGSPDGTSDAVGALAERDLRVHLIRRPKKMGLGTAYIEGFRWGKKKEFDLIVQMDGDWSHDPRYLPEFFDKASNLDLVVGSRYLNGISIVNWPFWRLVMSYGGCSLTRRMTGAPYTDPTSGFKCFRAAILDRIDLNCLRSNGYSFQIEFTYRVWQMGYKVGEIPIVFVDRTAGDSKMSFAIALETLWLIVRIRCLRTLGPLKRLAARHVLRRDPQPEAAKHTESNQA